MKDAPSHSAGRCVKLIMMVTALLSAFVVHTSACARALTDLLSCGEGTGTLHSRAAAPLTHTHCIKHARAVCSFAAGAAGVGKTRASVTAVTGGGAYYVADAHDR